MGTENQSEIPVVETLVGEGKKFKTVEDLAKGKLASDTHIADLERQIVELKSKMTNPGLETILNDLKTENTTENTSSNASSTTATQGLTEEQIVALIDRRNQATQIAVKQANTLAEVRKAYGDKTDEHLTQVAQTMGFSLEQLKNLAGTNPEAFKRLVDIQPQSTTSSVTGTHNSQALTTDTKTGQTKNKAYYEAKMREMGIRKFVADSALQTEMHRNLRALGEAWES